MKKRNKKKPQAAFVSQGCIGSDKAQGQGMRDAADAFRRKSMSLTPGKGDTRRTRIISDAEFAERWDDIFNPASPTKI
jgi:hypothetical protein